MSKNIIIEEVPEKDEVAAYKMWAVIHTDDGGWIEDDVEVTIYKDKQLVISEQAGNDRIVFLTAWQAQELTKILNKHYGK